MIILFLRLLLSNDRENWTSQEDAEIFFIGEPGYVSIAFSSGATIKSVVLDDVTIETASVPKETMCNDCETMPHIANITILDARHSSFQLSFVFSEDHFDNETIIFRMTFFVEYEFRRRRMAIEFDRRHLLSRRHTDSSLMLKLQSRYARLPSIPPRIEIGKFHNLIMCKNSNVLDNINFNILEAPNDINSI